jgi:nitrogen fixation/metabolism regulation signal transduction histidine kinase
MFKSFKYKFIVSFVTIEIFFILCIVGLNFFAIQKSTSKLMLNQIDSATFLIEDLIKAPMSVYDLATLDNIVNSKDMKNINSIIILDQQKRLLSSSYLLDYDINKILNSLKDRVLVINNIEYDLKYLTVYNDDILLGHLFILFDLNEFKQLIQNNKNNTLLVVLLEVFISTLIAYIIGVKLTNRLTSLSDTATKLGKVDNLVVEIPYQDDKTELGILSRSLYQMTNDIQERNKLLEDTKVVFDKLTEGIIVINHTNIISVVNNSFYNMFIEDNNEILYKNYNDISSGFLNDDKFKNILVKLTQNNGQLNGEITFKDKVFSFRADNITHRKVPSVIIVFKDITKEKRDQLLLQQQSKMAAMGEMIGNIAHQWRQPLNALGSHIVLVTTMYKKGKLNKKNIDQFSTKTQELIKKMNDTISDFRNFFNQNKTKVEFKIYDSIKSVLNILEITLYKNKIDVQIEGDTKLQLVSFRSELEQVLMILINNSKDALVEKNVENRFIKVLFSSNDDIIKIVIYDNAGGVETSLLEKIFEPYFTTKDTQHGTGIGLYMTKQIIENSIKGSLSVLNNEYGLETTIIIPKG